MFTRSVLTTCRDFIYRVERAFRDRGLRSDVLFLSPRIDLSAVIHRQIIEGVLAIAKISRSSEFSGKIPLQVYDHSHGVNNVRFNGGLLFDCFFADLTN